MAYYIGLMSGTSADGVDAVLIKSDNQTDCHVVAHVYASFTGGLDRELLRLQQTPECSIKHLGQLDHRLGLSYASVTQRLLKKSGLFSNQITAIGCHGQTIYHDPKGKYPFTLQIGDSNLLAQLTGIVVVSDFRRMDMAAGGDGAPLAPLLHKILFSHPSEVRVVVNLGGISNTTILRPGKPVTGFDNGPANCLMDGWVQQEMPSELFDYNGEWAESGICCKKLLRALLEEPYFDTPPPKSTGKELFNMQWLKHYLEKFSSLSTADIQATLCELTATIVARDILNFAEDTSAVYVCGGGSNNLYLMKRLALLLKGIKVTSTETLGMPAEHVEAAAFAILAKHRMEQKAGNIPSVTGATSPVLLGGVYRPRPMIQ